MTETVAGTKGTARADRAELRAVNPASGALIATYPVHTAEDVDAAVATAREAARRWSTLGFADREKAMLRWAAYLVNHSDEFAEVIHKDNGKPHEDAYAELLLALEHIRWAAKHAGRVLRPRKVGTGLLMGNFSATVEQRPFGVVGAIGPWNYPVYTPMGSLAYSLAAGNTVVFKPSEYTTTVGEYLVNAFTEANPHLPAGVLSLVTGFGETGAALCRSGVDKLAFTGSPGTGRKIMAACAENLTPVVLECGGKDPFIVAEDADVEAAADAVAFGAFSNSGQTCIGTERVYVARPVRDRFLEALRAQARELRPGGEADASYGPMTMPTGPDTVRRHIDAALAAGGRAVIGGPESVREPFVDPVVILDADENSAAVREETFGPTLTVRTVDSMDEAVELANATDYGLGASVFSRHHGAEIANRLNAGATAVNSVMAFAATSALPFGGHGESGFGRIHGEEGLREFSRPKSIAEKRFSIPGGELFTFNRNRLVFALVRKVVKLRHGRAR
ncbi:aldehyde dehydrogenase family protein [Sciscionella sediminilitoris]|uniref:aldehyde dehydrogenase family protein n=1 Tax=Sciscionella sediminilitoris TaxID=1445613 RepID=UPI0004DF300F|nr:aldehyde dehydrogenase family protein [Sciscionella sp. SE31]